MKRFLFLAVSALLTISSQAQDSFEGSVTMKVKLTGEGADQFAAFMPESYKYYFLGEDLRFEINGGIAAMMMGNMIVKQEEKIMYMVKETEKTAYKIPIGDDDDETDEEDSDISVEKTSETKKILGYTCTKYLLKSKDADQEVWATEEISLKSKNDQAASGGLFNGFVPGAILETSSEMKGDGMDGIIMTMTASEISTVKPDASLFEVPEGYEIVDSSLEELFKNGR